MDSTQVSIVRGGYTESGEQRASTQTPSINWKRSLFISDGVFSILSMVIFEGSSSPNI